MTATPTPLHYSTHDTPLTEVAHHKILAGTVFHCVQQRCDGVHHVWCSCAR